MPVNNNLAPKEFPFPVLFDEGSTTCFTNSLANINVKLVSAPDYDEIKFPCISFANATWADHPWTKEEIVNNIAPEIQDKIMFDIFKKRILPTTMENISLLFSIEGITVQEVTHILRYRGATFSAECTGDRFMNNKNFCVPTAIENSKDFYDRYTKICLDAKQLYCDMIDSRKICAHDARAILPRCSETFYFMRMNMKDAMTFIYDRIDKQIQPQTDNVIAYGMITALVNKYPILAAIFNYEYLHRKADFYVATARNYRASNFYCPDSDSDCFEYNEKDFVYGTVKRDDLLGTNEFAKSRDIFKMILTAVECFLKYSEEELYKTYSKEFLNRPFEKKDFGDLA